MKICTHYEGLQRELAIAVSRDRRSRASIASTLGISPQHLSQYTTGTRRIPLGRAELLAAILGYRLELRRQTL